MGGKGGVTGTGGGFSGGGGGGRRREGVRVRDCTQKMPCCNNMGIPLDWNCSTLPRATTHTQELSLCIYARCTLYGLEIWNQEYKYHTYDWTLLS